MRGLQVEIIPGPVKIRRHDRNEICAILPRISLAEFDSGNFCDCLRFVRWLKSPGQKGLLLDRLDRQTRVNARTSEKQKLLGAEIEACRNQIVLDLQILEEKIDRTIVIGLNAADSSCCYNNGIRSICREKFPNDLGVEQIQFTMCSNDEMSVAVFLKVAKRCTPYQT